MEIPTQETILPVIQLSITPVILISGLGSLVISMTNRMGRIVDRTRSLSALMRQADGEERAHIEYQLKVMVRRAKMMRLAMTLATSSMFVSGALIMAIFLGAILEVQSAVTIVGGFLVSVGLMLGGLAAFVGDIWMSLFALDAEVAWSTRPRKGSVGFK